MGTCYMKPEIVEYHDAWNLSDRTMQRNLSIHTELYDNVSLQSMNIRICKEESTKCFNETLNLSGTGFIGYFEMPEDAKAWIDANAISYSVFDVSINVSNAAGLSSGVYFYSLQASAVDGSQSFIATKKMFAPVRYGIPQKGEYSWNFDLLAFGDESVITFNFCDGRIPSWIYEEIK